MFFFCFCFFHLAQNGIALEENPCYEEVNVKVEENPLSRIEMEANLCYGNRQNIQLKKNECYGNTQNVPNLSNDQIIYETII